MRISIMNHSNVDIDIQVSDIYISDYTCSNDVYMLVLNYRDQRYIITTTRLSAASIIEAFTKEYTMHREQKAIIAQLNKDVQTFTKG